MIKELNIDLEKLVPSKTVRELMDFDKLADTEIATLVRYSLLDHEEKRRLFREIENRTDNAVLKEQLEAERLFRERSLAYMRENDGSFVYLLTIYYKEESWEEEIFYGCFADYEDALRYGKSSGHAFSIHKHPVLGAKGHAVYPDSGLGKEPLLKGAHECDGDDTASAWYGSDGRLESVEEYETISIPEHELTDVYMELPNPFERGDIITRAGGGDFVGVVMISGEKWRKSHGGYKREPDGHWVEGLGLDLSFTDTNIFVNEVTREGYMNHGHIVPTELEYYKPDEKLVQKELLEYASSVAKGESDFQCMMMSYDALVEKYRKDR